MKSIVVFFQYDDIEGADIDKAILDQMTAAWECKERG